jgi:hypothetical protein
MILAAVPCIDACCSVPDQVFISRICSQQQSPAGMDLPIRYARLGFSSSKSITSNILMKPPRGRGWSTFSCDFFGGTIVPDYYRMFWNESLFLFEKSAVEYAGRKE